LIAFTLGFVRSGVVVVKVRWETSLKHLLLIGRESGIRGGIIIGFCIAFCGSPRDLGPSMAQGVLQDEKFRVTTTTVRLLARIRRY